MFEIARLSHLSEGAVTISSEFLYKVCAICFALRIDECKSDSEATAGIALDSIDSACQDGVNICCILLLLDNHTTWYSWYFHRGFFKCAIWVYGCRLAWIGGVIRLASPR
jgi:hypothetical protein